MQQRSPHCFEYQQSPFVPVVDSTAFHYPNTNLLAASSKCKLERTADKRQSKCLCKSTPVIRQFISLTAFIIIKKGLQLELCNYMGERRHARVDPCLEGWFNFLLTRWSWNPLLVVTCIQIGYVNVCLVESRDQGDGKKGFGVFYESHPIRTQPGECVIVLIIEWNWTATRKVFHIKMALTAHG